MTKSQINSQLKKIRIKRTKNKSVLSINLHTNLCCWVVDRPGEDSPAMSSQ